MYEIAFKLGAQVDSSMRRAFDDASAAIESVGQETIELSQHTQELSDTFNIASKAVAATEIAITGIGAGIGAALRATDEYNTAMKQLQASTGLSTNEMEEMKEISKNLYNENLGEDWNDLAESISTVKSVTDLSKESLEEASKYAVMYRDVFGEEVSQSIKASDTMMKQFGITAQNSYNLLAQGAQDGLNKSDELLDSANEYAVYFKTLGFSANEMFDVFGAGLKNGAFNLDKIGDLVKEFGIRIKDGSESTTDALSYLFQADGFDNYIAKLQKGGSSTQEFMELASKVGRENAAALLTDLNKTGAASEKAYKDIEYTMGGAGQFLDDLSSGAIQGKDAFNQVIQKIKEIDDPMTQSQMAIALFGTQAEDLEMKTVLSLGNVKNAFDMTKNTMEEIGAIKYDTVGNAIKGIGRQFETGLLIPLGEKVLPYLNAFSNYLNDDFAGAIKSTKNVLSTVTPIVLGLATGILVYKGTLAGVGAAQVAFNTIQSASIMLYRAHRAAMIAYALYGGGVKGVIAGMRAAMVALNGTMLANPFLLVAAAIAGLIVAFYAAYKMSDTFRNKMDGAFSAVKNIVQSTVSYIAAVAPVLWAGFINSTQDAWSKVESVYSQSIGFIGTKMTQFSQWLNGLKGPAGDIVNYIKSSFSGIGNTLATLSPLIARLGLSFLGVSGPIGWVIASVISIGAFLYKLIKTNEEVKTSFLNGWNTVQNAFAPVLELFALAGQTLLSMLLPAVSEIATSFAALGPEFQKTGQVIRDSFVQLGPTFAQLGPAFSELGSTFIGLFGQITSTLIPMIAQGFTSLMPVIGQLFTTWITLSSTVATQVLPLLLSGVQTIFPMILSFVQSSLPLIVNLIGTLIPIIVQIATSILPLLLQGTQMIFPLILSIIQAVLPVAISLIGAIIPVILMIAQTVLPLVLQVVQMAFSLILSIIQSVIPIITVLLQGVALFITSIVIPAIQAILAIVQFVFPLIMLVISNAISIVTGVIQTFTSILKGDWDGAWNHIKKTAETIMNNIVNFFKSIKLFDIGKNIINGLVDGIKSMASKTLSAVGNIVNGIIKGINWVLGKVGVEVSLKEWDVPKYARGTQGHPGGLAILGDGGGPELFKTPNGSLGLSPGTDTLMNLPKGTQVIPHKETQRILTEYNPAIPAYAKGNVQNPLTKGVNWIKEKASYAKNVFNNTSNSTSTSAFSTANYPSQETLNALTNTWNTNSEISTIQNQYQNQHAMQTAAVTNNTAAIPFYKSGNVIGNAFKTGVNWVKETGSQAINAVKSGAGNAKEVVKAGASKVKDVALDVFSYIEDPSKLLNKVLEKYGVSVPNIAGPFGDIAKGSLKLIKEKSTTFLKEKLEGFGSWSGGAGAPADVQKWLTAAINITGVPMSWLGPLQTMAMKESGGNPKAINLWDSNFLAGHPSKGLMQTIDSTFNAYKMPGMNDIWNPIHNAVASIRYTQARYGSIFKTPGIASMAKGGGYQGYYQGGRVPNTQLGWVGERGPELMELPAGTQIRSNSDSQSILNKMITGMVSYAKGESSPAVATAGGGELPPIQLTIAPTINIGNDPDGSVYDAVIKAMKESGAEMESILMELLEKIQRNKKRRDLTW